MDHAGLERLRFAVELAQQSFDGISGDLPEWNLDRSEQRIDRNRLRRVVVADHGELLRNPQPQRIGALVGAEGHLVVGGENRGDSLFKQLRGGAAAAVDEAFGRAPQAQAPEPDILTLEILAAPEPIVPPEPEPQPEAETEPASEPEPEPTYTPPVFSAEEADGIRIAGACSYTPDKQTLLLQPSSLDFQQDGPTVLIVHTHSSEAYTMEAGFEYPESDELRTQDSRYSVIRIGDEIAQILQDAGIEVLHDTEPNDYPNYNGAYERMRQTIEGYLAAYPTIQMVLDLHRDAAEDAGGVPVALTAYPDGEACAELMLVVGTDEGGLPHPDWQENLANALKLQALLNRSAPGLCRDLDLRTERFNQHETPGSLLVEVGASGNTLAEALRSARILGNALVKLIRGEEA